MVIAELLDGDREELRVTRSPRCFVSTPTIIGFNIVVAVILTINALGIAQVTAVEVSVVA